MEPVEGSSRQRKVAPGVGERIRTARKFRGLTLKELAKKLGISWVTLEKYELGQQLPKIVVLQGIASVLGVNPNWLIYGEGLMISLSYNKIEVSFAPVLKKGSAQLIHLLKGFIRERGKRIRMSSQGSLTVDLRGFKDYCSNYYRKRLVKALYWSSPEEEYLPVPQSIEDPDVFAIEVHDDSMSPVINRGDLVVISPNSEVKSDDIALVIIFEDVKDIESAILGLAFTRPFLRRVLYPSNDSILLVPFNPQFETMFLPAMQVLIIGRAVLVSRKL